ncbi:HdeD family acid-resistance protein [Companilactobacillus metriopterae]|uniref:HdeD family acid-resistance protein n=1 Tax=Companilactobacillus metriopterae TaxID=1909267 RepID=UPI00100A7A8B|nr:DUF308 domain-containing protein [Companilactobacillus metriopterae]
MKNARRGFDWLSLIVGILSLYVGYVVMSYPLKSLSSVAYIFGIFILIRGIFQLWFSNQETKYLGIGAGGVTIMGIIYIILGIVLIVNNNFAQVVMVYLFAILFFMDSIFQIMTSRFYANFGKGYYWLIVILAILNFIVAIILLFEPLLAASVIIWLLAFFFITTGIMEIAKAF